jgi:hypothetical protein
VKKEVPEEVCRRDLQTADDLRSIGFSHRVSSRLRTTFTAMSDQSLKKVKTDAVTSTLATEIGNSPSQPNRMS